MDTIDPEVRADVEFAARLLNKHLQRRGGAAPGLADCASSAAPRPGSAGAGGQPAYAQSTAGEVDASGFVALMEEVVGRTKGELEGCRGQGFKLGAWTAASSARSARLGSPSLPAFALPAPQA